MNPISSVEINNNPPIPPPVKAEAAPPSAKPKRRRRRRKKKPANQIPSPHEHLKYRYNDKLSKPLMLTESEHALLEKLFTMVTFDSHIGIVELIFLALEDLMHSFHDNPPIIKDPIIKGCYSSSIARLENNQKMLLANAYMHGLRKKSEECPAPHNAIFRNDRFFAGKEKINSQLSKHFLLIKEVCTYLNDIKHYRSGIKRLDLATKEKTEHLLMGLKEYEKVSSLIKKLILHPNVFEIIYALHASDFPGQKLLDKGSQIDKGKWLHQWARFILSYHKYLNKKQFTSIEFPCTRLEKLEEITKKFSQDSIPKELLFSFEQEYMHIINWIEGANRSHTRILSAISKGKVTHSSFYGEKKTQDLSEDEFKSQIQASHSHLNLFAESIKTLMRGYNSQIMFPLHPNRFHLDSTSFCSLEILQMTLKEKTSVSSHPLAVDVITSLDTLASMFESLPIESYTLDYYLDKGYLPWKEELKKWEPYQKKAQELTEQLMDLSEKMPKFCQEELVGNKRNQVKEHLVILDTYTQDLLRKCLPYIALAKVLDNIIIDSFNKEEEEVEDTVIQIEKNFMATYLPIELTEAAESFNLLILLDDIAPLPSKPKTPKVKKLSQKEKNAIKRRQKKQRAKALLERRGKKAPSAMTDEEFHWRRGTKVGRIISELCSSGFSKLPASGDHWKFEHEDGRKVIIPYSSEADTLKRGTLKSVASMANNSPKIT